MLEKSVYVLLRVSGIPFFNKYRPIYQPIYIYTFIGRAIVCVCVRARTCLLHCMHLSFELYVSA